jgi:hypothetical protein
MREEKDARKNIIPEKTLTMTIVPTPPFFVGEAPHMDAINACI